MRPPLPKRQKTNAATVLGSSDFPSAKVSTDNPQTPLDLFIANEEDTSFTRVLTSTPNHEDQADPPTEVIDNLRREMSDTIERRIQAAVTAIEQNYEHRLNACQRRIANLERQLRERDQRSSDEIDHRFEQFRQRIHDLEQSAQNAVAERPRAPPRPGNLSAIILRPQDVSPIHDYDSEHPQFNLTQDVVSQIKDFSKTKRIFISNLARKMFSMEERVRDTNVAGSHKRPPLSPTKTRYRRICNFVSQQYNCAMDSALQSEVRKAIDSTNRRFRDDLKLRKHREFAQPDDHFENDVLADSF